MNPSSLYSANHRTGRKLSNTRISGLLKRIYFQNTYIGLKKDLEGYCYYPPCKYSFTIQLASNKHILEALYRARLEKQDYIYEMIRQKWEYNSSTHRCYVALTSDTQDLCCMQWIALPSKDNPEGNSFYSLLNKDEVLLEHSYVFKQYREKGIMPSAIYKLCDIACSVGFKKMVTYVQQNDVIALRDFHKAGFFEFELRTKSCFLNKKYHSVQKIIPAPIQKDNFAFVIKA